jgi:hypothetical protein
VSFARKVMNDEERRIWEAAFAYAMVDDFRRFQVGASFDRALECMSAERAETIADRVVDRMRDWKLGRV